jgi:flagellar biosynthesis protein FlhG
MSAGIDGDGSHAPRSSAQEVWAFGGGKGGAGRTTLAAAVGFQLSRLGRRVLLIDASFSSPVLGETLGARTRPRALQEFVAADGGTIDAFIGETPYPSLLLAAAAPGWSEPRLSPSWSTRLRAALSALSVDHILIDTMAAVSTPTLDLLNLADQVIFVAQPEAADSIGLANLLTHLALRRLATRGASPDLRQFGARLGEAAPGSAPRGGRDIIRRLEGERAASLKEALARMDEIDATVVANGIRDEQDRGYGPAVAAIARRRYGFRMRFSGSVRFDDAIARAQRRGGFCMVDANRSQGADDIRRLARGLVARNDLSPVF